MSNKSLHGLTPEGQILFMRVTLCDLNHHLKASDPNMSMTIIEVDYLPCKICPFVFESFFLLKLYLVSSSQGAKEDRLQLFSEPLALPSYLSELYFYDRHNEMITYLIQLL